MPWVHCDKNLGSEKSVGHADSGVSAVRNRVLQRRPEPEVWRTKRLPLAEVELRRRQGPGIFNALPIVARANLNRVFQRCSEPDVWRTKRLPPAVRGVRRGAVGIVFASPLAQPVDVVLFFTHPVRGVFGIPYLTAAFCLRHPPLLTFSPALAET